MIKKINKLIKFGFIYLGFFLVGDAIVSNFFLNTVIENNCYNWKKNFYELKKNCYAKEKWIKKSKSYKVYIDENGFRFNGKTKNNFDKNDTAIFFGGSFTYGMGAEYENSFVGLIEEEKKNYNILNLGVAGYSPSVFNYQLQELIKKNIFPKKIFLVLDIVDVNSEATNWDSNNENYRPINITSIPDKENNEKKFKNFKRKNFKVTRIISTSINNSLRSLRYNFSRLNQKYKRPEKSQYGSFLFKDFEELDQNFWQPYGFKNAIIKITKAIEKIASKSKEINAEFYIIIYPWPDSLEYGQDKFNWENFAEDLCKKNSCNKVINFFPDFEEIKKTSDNWVNKLFIEDDVHLTTFGHQIIAKKIIKNSF